MQFKFKKARHAGSIVLNKVIHKYEWDKNDVHKRYTNGSYLIYKWEIIRTVGNAFYKEARKWKIIKNLGIIPYLNALGHLEHIYLAR